MIKTEILKIKGEWSEALDACRATVSKKFLNKEPSKEFKKALVVCEHSPLRTIWVKWRWQGLPSYIATHFARHHIGCEKYIGTQREDRTGVDRSSRSQMDLVPMRMEGNIQAVLNISERRLCTCADKLAIKYWQSLLEEIKKFDEVVYWANVPQCVRCGGCIEGFSKCNFYQKLMQDSTLEEQMNVIKRYDIYNEKVRKFTLNR